MRYLLALLIFSAATCADAKQYWGAKPILAGIESGCGSFRHHAATRLLSPSAKTV